MTEFRARLGFVGLGAMGQPMAENLLKAGLGVTVYDIAIGASAALESQGATVAQSPASLARSSEIVHVNVRTEDQVEDVLFGGTEGGVVGNLPAGGIILIHSTISPGACSSAAKRAAEHDIVVLDAPVTGSIKAAVEGTLSFIIGGPPQAIERCAPVLEILGSRITPVGEPGNAQLAKLVNNLLAGVNTVAVAEGLALARAAGLSDAAVLEVVNAGTGASFASTMRDALLDMGRQSDLAGLGYKDLQLALAEARSRQLPLPVTALATQYLSAYFQGHGPSQASAKHP